jgi:hypothetical protein
MAGADDAQARVAPRQLVAQVLERGLAPAVEQERLPGARRALARLLHQVGAVDAARQVVAEQVHRPHQRLAVRDGEVGLEHGAAQLRVLLEGHDRVHGRDADVAARPAVDGVLDPVERALVVGERERDAEDCLRGDRHRLAGGLRGCRCGGGHRRRRGGRG